MEDKGRESDHLMLITPERVFYAGLLGRPRQRCPGSCHVYVALKGGLHLTTDDGESHGDILVTLPNQRHTITSDYRTVVSVTLEPESMPDGTLEALAERLTGPDKAFHARKILAAYELLRQRRYGNIGNAEFDEMCFGEALPRRTLDPRVTRAVARIGRFSGEPVTADSCAAEAGLSASRFLHLFKEETGISFRSFRAWKRARHLLHFANQDLNLAHLAQDIGYPDSTHFSHSIRRFYGLKPRAIFVGSRDLAIYRSGETTVKELAEAS
ncbi:helix-turn-helix transcriptional regulator [Bradyrhizobium manausense]|uniref:AraC family transcriptional regulator n=1 Tax=Bradyrhizobium TaxID=374 RepID=UPI001BA8C092|nr:MULTISPECIES: AraC family transcriptional regulator [Bradyrhizobium]MBR0829301.1 helix-turn-helix transcriptional regulator [Bradyrhizobium manausense]UVO29777.1 AraC family transcriptional regulator [Bradyrhizobium arachidis]